MKKNIFFVKLFAILILLALTSCSGGGGGGEGEGSSRSGRTTKTAIRVIHSSVDAVPLGLVSNGVFLNKFDYLGESEFYDVAEGANALTLVTGDRVSQAIKSLSIDALKSTEYTLFAYGAERDREFRVEVLPEPVLRPEDGMSRVQVLHGLSDVSSINFTIGTEGSRSVAFGKTSGFIDLPVGTYPVTITGSRGNLLGSLNVNLENRGEATVVVAGKVDYNFISFKVYQDLD